MTAIVVVYGDNGLVAANRQFFRFFDDVQTLVEFHRKYGTLEQVFLEVDRAGYSREGQGWGERVTKAPLKARLRRAGRDHLFRVTGRRMRQRDDVVIVLNEISDLEDYKRLLKQKQADLERQLYVDSLTGLPNRTSLVRDIAEITSGLLLLVDIDGFRQINDFYGNDSGDEVLRSMAITLGRQHPLEHAVLYRLNGDEFALLGKAGGDEIGAVLSRFARAIATEALQVGDQTIALTVSIGAALFGSGDDAAALFFRADMALQKAKSDRREFVIYDTTLDTRKQLESNIEWTRRLRRAFDEDRVVPFFQPILNNRTGVVEKFETLVRIVETDGKVISPFFFLDVSKQSKLYPRITRRMIEKSFQYFRDKACEFSINLALEDMLDEKTREFIFDQIRQSGNGGRVVFEILESDNIENYREVKEFVHRAKGLGCSIAIDDFGTGYSNFQNLLELDIDYVKIDGSIVRDVLHRANAALIVEAIVDFAHKLGARTIAEFVEDVQVQQRLRRLGVDYTQGYLVGRPEAEARGLDDCRAFADLVAD